MAFVAAPNIIEVHFRGTFDGERVENRIHVNALTEPTTAICQSVAAAAGAWWDAEAQPYAASNVYLREVYCKSLHEANAAEGTYVFTPAAQGAATGDSLPNNVALALSLRTGLTGRSARGRWFWYGFVEGQVDASRVNPTTVGILQGAMTQLLTDISALGYQWSIVSFRTNNAPRVGGPVYFPVTDIVIVDSVVDSQRRRLPGRGQ